MAHPNEELARKGYKAFAAGDIETVKGLLADDVLWHIPGRSPLAGDYKGRDEVLGFFAKIAERSGGTFKLDVHDVLANDEHAVVLVVAKAERAGKRLNEPLVHVSHIKNGKITEFWAHPSDQYSGDEFWS
jgi:ketosteroid isomerase-like protein